VHTRTTRENITVCGCETYKNLDQLHVLTFPCSWSLVFCVACRTGLQAAFNTRTSLGTIICEAHSPVKALKPSCYSFTLRSGSLVCPLFAEQYVRSCSASRSTRSRASAHERLLMRSPSSRPISAHLAILTTPFPTFFDFRLSRFCALQTWPEGNVPGAVAPEAAHQHLSQRIS
jgi:hypothetical protein